MSLLISAVLDANAARRAQPVLEASANHDHVGLPADPVEEMISLLETPSTIEDLFVVMGEHEGRPVAVGRLQLPLLDNTATAMLDVQVCPSARRAGFGSQIARHCLETARARGRTKALLEISAPMEGSGPGAGFAASLGARPVLGEVRRSLDLSTVDMGQVAACRAEAERFASGYRLVSWVDRAPRELLGDLARLAGRMSTDPPLGDMDWEPELWDEQRWLTTETEAKAAQRVRVGTAAVHDQTGRAVGYTDIGVSRLVPDVGYQWATIVEPDHRGQRLGLLLKAANLQALRRELPAVEWVNTWNASANSHMIAINERLGFRAVERWSEWQLAVVS